MGHHQRPPRAVGLGQAGLDQRASPRVAVVAPFKDALGRRSARVDARHQRDGQGERPSTSSAARPQPTEATELEAYRDVDQESACRRLPSFVGKAAVAAGRPESSPAKRQPGRAGAASGTMPTPSARRWSTRTGADEGRGGRGGGGERRQQPRENADDGRRRSRARSTSSSSHNKAALRVNDAGAAARPDSSRSTTAPTTSRRRCRRS